VAEPDLIIKQTHGLAIKQERSKLTYSALIKAGFKMLEQSDLQNISVAELAVEAGYSVGAFYARFRSKDEFFDAMVAEHLVIRTNVQKQLFTSLTPPTLPGELISNVVNYYWEHRKFWRAVIARSLRDPESWARMRKHRVESTKRFLDAISSLIKRPLTDKEKGNISFAFQVTLGTVDITLVNQPGPLFMGQKQFIEELTRAFVLVAEYDSLCSNKKAPPRKK